ncbi:MAG: thiosulfate/3-mercaptopyruvate sulfurtransferase [Chloroflexi bacterium]|jgi:thiosulfate/3-mercaptopyruvate sulfurtransferase|nr:MAG: thiosulfate/3-mercaptopyruvate sulfurtransferase [Chloroflexota bacterium]
MSKDQDYALTELLINTEWLQNNLSNEDIRIVDCGYWEAYKRAHIPGAVGIRGDHYFKDPDTNRTFISNPEQFSREISELGISNNTLVVAYDDFGSLWATRLWWALKYYGHHSVKILNGGWQKWLREGRQITDVKPQIQKTKFDRTIDQSILATAEQVMDTDRNNPEKIVFDVRSTAEYKGENDRGNKRSGHIPGAKHLEWLNFVDKEKSMTFKSASEIEALLAPLDITKDKEITTYCQGGIRAAHVFFVLELLGYKNLRVYDGSFREWGNRQDTAIE